MQPKARNQLLLVFILLFPFAVFLAAFVFLSDDLPLPPLPNPNGYTDLVKAGEMVSSQTYDFENMDQTQLGRAVSQNAGALAVARAALTNQCAVTLKFSAAELDPGNPSSHFNDLSGLKELARAFIAEGRLAEMQNRTNDAIHSYLDAVHLANASSRGGALIDELVGIAIESLGTSSLQKMAGQLDASSCREAASQLETLDSQRQTWDEVMQQEQAWAHHAFPGVRYDIARIVERRSLVTEFQAAERKFDAQELKTRQLTLDLAVRAYELDKGKPPTRVNDLVPDYLKAVPQDPITGADLVLKD